MKSLPKALAWQIVIFGLAHIKGIGWTACIEVVSVMLLAVAFTYTAYKTQTLLAGIVFHFLHDALLFLVQPPGGVYVGLPENLLFYALLWLMVGVACLVVRYAADHLQVSAGSALYPGPDGSVSTAQLP